MTLSDTLFQFLGDTGLKVNAKKTVLITTEPQPPPCLITSTGAVIKVKEKESGHKWLGCMLSSAGSRSGGLDIDYHLQSANYHLQSANSAFSATFTFTFARPSQRLRSCKGHGVTQLYKPKWARQNCT